MVFWLDRFRREDDEDIWEELRQMLLNPPSEEEIAMKKRLEQAKIDETLERMFPMEGKVTKSYPRNPYEEIDSKENWSDEFKALKKAEVAKIQETARAREKEINREHILEQAKNYGGALLEIGSAAVPGYGTAKLATTGAKYLGKKLAPKVGRKLAEQIEKSAAQGAVIGGVEGAVNGKLNNENVAKAIIRDSVLGTATGATIGAVGGYPAHIRRKKNLEELVDKRKDWGIAFTKQSGKPAEAIDKLLEQKQGFVPKATKKRGIGDIDFVWGKGSKKGYGFSHIIDQRNNDGLNGEQFAKQVPNIISTGNIEKISNQPNIDFIRFGEDSALVKKVWDDKKRNWIVTAFKDEESLNKSTNRTPDIVNNQNGMAPPLNLNRDSGIIPSSQNNLNPSQQTIQKPQSYAEWLEELKRRRKKGWW